MASLLSQPPDPPLSSSIPPFLPRSLLSPPLTLILKIMSIMMGLMGHCLSPMPLLPLCRPPCVALLPHPIVTLHLILIFTPTPRLSRRLMVFFPQAFLHPLPHPPMHPCLTLLLPRPTPIFLMNSSPCWQISLINGPMLVPSSLPVSFTHVSSSPLPISWITCLTSTCRALHQVPPDPTSCACYWNFLSASSKSTPSSMHVTFVQLLVASLINNSRPLLHFAMALRRSHPLPPLGCFVLVVIVVSPPINRPVRLLLNNRLTPKSCHPSMARSSISWWLISSCPVPRCGSSRPSPRPRTAMTPSNSCAISILSPIPPSTMSGHLSPIMSMTPTTPRYGPPVL